MRQIPRTSKLGWGALAVAFAVLLLHTAERLLPVSLTPDSPSYLITALEYARSGTLVFGPGREPGYRVFLLGLSRLGGWTTTETLGTAAAWTQSALYVLLVVAVAAELGRRAGVWAAVAVVAMFGLDRYHIAWVATVQSEAIGRLLILGGAALALWGLRRGRGWGVAGGFLLFGLIPLCRPADMAWTLALLAVPGCWLLARWRRPGAWAGAAGLAALLLAPAMIYAQAHGVATGYVGISERGPWHQAGRLFTVVAPDKLRAAGLPEEVVEEIARPIHEQFAPLYDTQVPIPDDLGRPTPLVVHAIPTPRDTPPELAAAFLERRGLPADPYAVAAFLQRQVGLAVKADPAAVWRATSIGLMDHLRIPLLKPVYDASLRNKLFLAIPLVMVASLAVLAATWRRRRWPALALGLAAAGLLPGYFAIISFTGHVNLRFVGNMHVFAALLALASLCLSRQEGFQLDQPRR